MHKRRIYLLLLAVLNLCVIINLPYMMTSYNKGDAYQWWSKYWNDGYSTMGNKSLRAQLQIAKSECRKDPECSEFHDLIDEQWPPGKPRGAVVKFIGRRSLRDKVFRRFAEHFDKNFNDAFQYPLIVFHKEQFTETDKKLMRSWTNSTVYFQLVKFVTPPSVNESHITHHCGGLHAFPIGYRHMCRFYVKTMLEEPILATEKLEYIWRLDDYSVITDPIDYDIFRFMRSRNMQYGYAVDSLHSQDCVVGLEEAVQRYLEDKSTKQKFTWQLPRVVHNTFEISEMNLLRSPSYIDFINYIDSAGGIFNYRWCDAPIKSLAISILVSQSAVHQFKDIGYRHVAVENIGKAFNRLDISNSMQTWPKV